MAIRVIDGPVHQWDCGRYVILSGRDAESEQVHFAPVHHAKKAIVVSVLASDDGPIAPIPNSMLTRPEDICAWAWDDDITLSGVRIPVMARPKPDNYIYVPTEVFSYEAIHDMVQVAIGEVNTKLDYVPLHNKPSIEGVELVGDRLITEFGILLASDEDIDGLFEEE